MICKDSSFQDEETKLICKSMNSNIVSTIKYSELNEVENCASINKRFYLHDIKQCVENGCPNDYYQFNFDCYIMDAPKMPMKYLTKNVNQN